MESQGQNGKICEECDSQDRETWFCEHCDAVFCNQCWDQPLPHRKGRKGKTGVVHEKADWAIAKRLESILTPTEDAAKQNQLHEDDDNTAWFGVDHREGGTLPGLNDYGRFPDLMQASWNDNALFERWPHVISVIGGTGDGKSSIINMLIDLSIRDSEFKSEFPTPVVGAAGSSTPTSGNVHLYADPHSFHSRFPKLFADSEGLQAGESTPTGDRSNLPQALASDRVTMGRKFWAIQWVTDPETRSRQFAVRHLYPRFLYTFSDVVVYVLRNERQFEKTALEYLLEWASKPLEGSVNQPTLPHAVIVLNAAEHSLPQWAWDVESATKKLLSALDDAIFRSPTISKYIAKLNKSGRVISCTLDLVKCYYSSIRVVRIPAKGRYMLMDQQIHKLYDEIDGCCKKSHKKKRTRRLDLNADELAETLISGFDHFSKNLDRPFDFIELSWKTTPIPQDFQGNILRLAITIKETSQTRNGPEIFGRLSEMVASCIMLDLVRRRIKGTAKQWLERYLPIVDWVVKEFCTRWKCSYTRRSQACVNTQVGHAKGHQDANGRLFGSGPYESDFTADRYLDAWHDLLTKALAAMQNEMSKALQNNGVQEEKIATDLHRKRIGKFYRSFHDIDQFCSHAACFCCLRELPEHPLPCGHVLCTPCVQAYGERRSSTSWEMDSCPLHSRDSVWPRARIQVKPPLAGVRVLCLDGGGMRGIVQLQVLAALERRLGVPLHEFFDLIVGTSAGGINAIGLGVKQWSVQDCITKFKSICHKAFSPQGGLNVPLVGFLISLHHQGKYKTQPLEEGLQQCFGDELLFGGRYTNQRSHKKVAVVSTTEANQDPVIFTNYNRRVPTEKTPWKLERPERKDSEFKLWEAARATSAAPYYFKPFSKDGWRGSYVDGAMYYNNPVRVADTERKLLWPDVDEAPVDFMLSVGTGRNSNAIERERSRRQSGMLSTSNAEDEPSPADTRKKFLFFKMPRIAQVIKDRLHSLLDTQNAWDSYLRDVGGSSRRYLRISPELHSLPKIDEIDKLESVEDEVRNFMTRSTAREHITQAARCLYATSFYFEKRHSPASSPTSGVRINGTIRCRFEGQPCMTDFGERLDGEGYGSFRPYFTISTSTDGHIIEEKDVLLPKEFFKNMKKGICSIPDVQIAGLSERAETMIELHFNRYGDQTYPISGFPRCLLAEDARLTSRENERRAALQRMSLRSLSSCNSTPRSSAFSDSTVPSEFGSSSVDTDVPRPGPTTKRSPTLRSLGAGSASELEDTSSQLPWGQRPQRSGRLKTSSAKPRVRGPVNENVPAWTLDVLAAMKRTESDISEERPDSTTVPDSLLLRQARTNSNGEPKGRKTPAAELAGSEVRAELAELDAQQDGASALTSPQSESSSGTGPYPASCPDSPPDPPRVRFEKTIAPMGSNRSKPLPRPPQIMIPPPELQGTETSTTARQHAEPSSSWRTPTAPMPAAKASVLDRVGAAAASSAILTSFQKAWKHPVGTGD